ncbi:hypothetical protein ACHAPT_010864 [Fusarium lateritium]
MRLTSLTGAMGSTKDKLKALQLRQNIGQIAEVIKTTLASPRQTFESPLRQTTASSLGEDDKEDILPGKLRNRLYKASKDNNPEVGKHFLTEANLSKLLSVKAVERELRRCQNFSNHRRLRGMIARSPEVLKADARKICGGLDKSRKLTLPSASARRSKDASESQDCKPYRKILAILVLIQRPCRIWSFIDEGICDADLPLTRFDIPGPGKRWELRRQLDRDVSLKCFEPWGIATLAEFEEFQWTVLSPSLHHSSEKYASTYEFEKARILPFTSWENPLKEGGHGQVYKVGIHPDHHSFGESGFKTSIRVFAIKKLKSSSEFLYKREAGILRRLVGRHEHIICLLATYTQYGDYHLIFPWAEANLLEFWQRINPCSLPNKKRKVLRWLAEQCRGIAHALSYIHRYKTFSGKSLVHPSSLPLFPSKAAREVNRVSERSPVLLFGRHGDIKPENILWFPAHNKSTKEVSGILKISDFGIAEFSSQAAVDARTRGLLGFSRTYRPPECDLEFNDGRIGPSYDIWSLGCVFLQFIAWWLGGWEHVDEFASQRLGSDHAWFETLDNRYNSDAFFSDVFFTSRVDETGKKEAVVKPAVTQFIKDLRGQTSSTGFASGVLGMIEQEMLVVEKPQVNGTKVGRATASQIAQRLAGMQNDFNMVPGA